MRKLKARTLKWILFALCLFVAVICCTGAYITFGGNLYATLMLAGVAVIPVCLLAAWWFSMRKSWRMCLVSGALAELSYVLQAASFVMLITGFALDANASSGAPAAIAVCAVFLLIVALEFALVWMIQRRTHGEFRDGTRIAHPAVRRGWVLSVAWMAVGIACLVFWIIVLIIGFGREWWPLALCFIPLMLCIAAFCYAWWMSAYAGKGLGIAFTVLMALISVLMCAAAVTMCMAISNALPVILVFAQIVWLILYIAVEEVMRHARLSRRESGLPSGGGILHDN